MITRTELGRPLSGKAGKIGGGGAASIPIEAVISAPALHRATDREPLPVETEQLGSTTAVTPNAARVSARATVGRHIGRNAAQIALRNHVALGFDSAMHVLPVD